MVVDWCVVVVCGYGLEVFLCEFDCGGFVCGWCGIGCGGVDDGC